MEYRRTVVTVDSIDDDVVWFCVMGLRAHKEGYYVQLSANEAKTKATCLVEWCRKHPEDDEEMQS